jgi:hypothetical protein
VRAFAVVNTVAAAVNALLWVGLAWIGWGLLSGVERQHVAGYPSRAQFIYYLGFPLVMAACALALYAFARFTRLGSAAIFSQVLVFFVLLPFLFFYGGGV